MGLTQARVGIGARQVGNGHQRGQGQRLDASIKQTLLDRFAAYLDGVEQYELPAAVAEETDLFSVFVELSALRNEVRTQSRLVKEALDQFRGLFDTLQSSHAAMAQELNRARKASGDQERALLKPLLVDMIDIRDRLAAGLKPPPRRRWFERWRSAAKRDKAEAWREGLRMTLRRLDGVLADRRIVPTETVGRPFDPRLASAVATVENRALADGVVVEELRPGFLWHDELLRPAEVVVAKRRPKREISGDG
jgi:molecular chaperone GrpE